MLTWMKRLVAGGAMALAIGATGVIVTSPAYAEEAKKPAVTAGFLTSSAAYAGEVTITPEVPMAKAIAPPARSFFIQVNILNLSLKC